MPFNKGAMLRNQSAYNQSSSSAGHVIQLLLIMALVASSIIGCGGVHVAKSKKAVAKPKSITPWKDPLGYWSFNSVRALALDSARKILYAGTFGGGNKNKSVWRCANPNASPSWTDISGGVVDSLSIISLAYDPMNNILYAAACDPEGNDGRWSGKGVWRCTNPDRKPVWTQVGEQVGEIQTAVINSLGYDSKREILYAGSDNWEGTSFLWRCTNLDSNAEWTSLGDKSNVGSVESLFYDQKNNVLYAGTYGRGIWRCTRPDRSPNWRNTALTSRGVDLNYIHSLFYDPNHDVLYAEASDNTDSSKRSVWRCMKGTWIDIGDNRKGVSAATILLAYDSTHNYLYASCYGNACWVGSSPDAAVTWSSIGGPGDAIWSFIYDSSQNVLYAGTDRHGVWRCSTPDTSPSWSSTGGGAGIQPAH